jgi:hypothetical protein
MTGISGFQGAIVRPAGQRAARVSSAADGARLLIGGERGYHRRTMRLACALALAFAASGCAVYDAPPEPSIAGATEGLLPDPKAPIVVSFDKPAIADTIKLEIAPYVPEPPNYDTPPPAADVLFAHDPKTGDTGGTSVIAADGTSITLTPKFELPAGEEFLLVVEPGLSDLAGTVTKVERRITFGYASNLDCKAPAAVVRTGAYFMIAAVTEPFAVRVNLWASVDVDASTGALKIQYSKAIRNPSAQCPTPCASTDVCQLEPTPMCVAPSTPATSVDEFADYVPSPDPPAGFGFSAIGCTVDESATTASFATARFDIVVDMPSVTLRNSAMNASFTVDSEDVLRGSGSLSSDQVLLGTNLVGMGAGELTARSVTSAQAPPGIPGP